MKQRLGLGSGSALVRLFLAPQFEDSWEPSWERKGSGSWKFPFSHPFRAWWVSFALRTVASFGVGCFFHFSWPRSSSVTAEGASAGYSPSSLGQRQRQRVLNWPRAPSSHFLRSSSGRSANHVGRQLPSRKTLEATRAFHCRAWRHMKSVGPVPSPQGSVPGPRAPILS